MLWVDTTKEALRGSEVLIHEVAVDPGSLSQVRTDSFDGVAKTGTVYPQARPRW